MSKGAAEEVNVEWRKKILPGKNHTKGRGEREEMEEEPRKGHIMSDVRPPIH